MAPQERGTAIPAEATLEFWIFFSPGDGDFTKTLSEIQGLARSEPGLRIRPVFIVDDAPLLKKPTEALAQNVKGLRALVGPEFSMRVWDDDGLAAARALGLERLPAIVRLERDRAGIPRKAHVAYGLGVNLKELSRCDR
jgi:hypothetical protein